MFYDVTVVASTERTAHTYLVSYNIADILSNTLTPTHSPKLATKIFITDCPAMGYHIFNFC